MPKFYPPKPALQHATDFFEPKSQQYMAFTEDLAVACNDWIDNGQPMTENESKKRCWQLRCIVDDEEDSEDYLDEQSKLRILVVNGATSFFALAKFLSETLGWRAEDKPYCAQPSKGTVPPGSHWTLHRDVGNGICIAALIGTAQSVYQSAGNGAPYFTEKLVKVFQILRRRGDDITFTCKYGRVTVVVDGVTRSNEGEPRFVPRLVGADDGLLKDDWTVLNQRLMEKMPKQWYLVRADLTEEERQDIVDSHYKYPLFDNRGNALDKRQNIAELHRIVALPFRIGEAHSG